MSAESARVYFMKRVKDCKDVPLMISKMYSEDGQVYSVYCNCLVLLSTIRMQSKHKQTKRSRRNTYRLQLSQ